LVQAAPTEAETRFLLAQADANPAVLGVVGWVDMLAADAPARIEKLATHPRLKGLRPMLQDIADAEWILQPALAPALRAMADCGLVFDALVKSVHLPHVLTLAARHPELRMVIDHCAKPDIAAGEWQPWADGIARIANETQAMCKLSGLMTEAVRVRSRAPCGAGASMCCRALALTVSCGAATGLCWSWPAVTRSGGTRRSSFLPGWMRRARRR
jgi:L-fuconolactonase